MSANDASPRRGALELARMLAALAWVSLATAVGLGALGALPGWIAGEPHEVRVVATVDEAERFLSAPLALPSYFPQRLGWPPRRIRVAGGSGGSAELSFAASADGQGEVRLLQATTAGAAIAPAFLGTGTELSVSPATVGGAAAVHARRLVDGEAWEELAWERDGRRLVLRTRGDLDELFRMARSVHRRGRP
jgi:hypothetical protein